MEYNEMCQAVRDAQNTIRLGDMATKKLSELIVGRLKITCIAPEVLAELKRELRDFNMNKMSWKKP